jgi:hypothetical protein
MSELRDLTCRLERLEKQNRRLKSLVALFVIVVSAGVLMGQTVAPAQKRVEAPANVPADGKLRAEAFILMDDKGKERASLVTDGTGSVFFVMFDKDGRPRADIQVTSYGPSLNFYDPNARPRLVMGSTTLVASHVSRNGIVEKNPPSSMVMFDSGGGLLWRTP